MTARVGPRYLGHGLFEGCEACGDLHCLCGRGPESRLDGVDWRPQAIADAELKHRLAEFDRMFPPEDSTR